MKGNTFHIVDVFAESLYAGNQLAVVRDGHLFDDSQMQRIAKEFNFAETTFVRSEKAVDGAYDVRIFTPDREIPFAGHPTLGTSWIIQQKILNQEVEELTLALKAGRVPVKFQYESGIPGDLWMHQLKPNFIGELQPDMLADVLGIENDGIDDRFPVQEVSTGTPFIIVPVKDLATQKKIVVDIESHDALIADTEAKAILTFCPETVDSSKQLNVRMFAPHYGVPEDAATGSANGCLAAYLAQNEYFGTSKVDVVVEQGLEIGRPSALKLRSDSSEGTIDVFVGGRVVEVATGQLTKV